MRTLVLNDTIKLRQVPVKSDPQTTKYVIVGNEAISIVVTKKPTFTIFFPYEKFYGFTEIEVLSCFSGCYVCNRYSWVMSDERMKRAILKALKSFDKKALGLEQDLLKEYKSVKKFRKILIGL